MDAARDMATFQVLARMGTISAAAHELGVAPSAVSRRLKALEARLGIELVRRTTRAMVLTPAGEAYLAKATELLRSIDALEEEMRDEALGASGQIRLAAPMSFGLSSLVEPIDQFLKQHPNISLDIDLRDATVDLVKDGFDLALRIGDLPPSTLIAKKLCDVPSVTCASPDFIKRHGPFHAPQDLEGLPGLAYVNRARNDMLDWVDADGNTGKVQLQKTISANNGDILTELAAAGHGVYWAPQFLMQNRMDSGELISLFPDLRWPTTGLHALWPPTGHLAQRVRLLIDFLATSFSGSPKA
ncbi:MAG: LysR family transcriptional regulator [Pseudomonadota bacterium]